MQRHEALMRLAIAEAEAALARGEVPVGAVIVQGEKVLARAGNKREIDNDPTGHAELIALREAARALGGRRLTGCTLYVTLEPCPMCAGAIALSGLDAIYFGAHDPRMGCCGSIYRLTEDTALGLGVTPAHGGLLAEPCAALLQEFFAQRRS
ncbi:MAG: nucleoside deaminase [Oscillospiraceae bacterium]|nr:nucleoside deaminase [Oscillospiraceae bacterium]